jgi:hypothetical protein
LHKIAKGFSASTEDVLRYLYALDRASFHAYIDLDGKKVSQLNSEQNAINLTREISKILLEPISITIHKRVAKID